MKSKYIGIFLLGSLLSSGLTSCNDFLDMEPLDQVTPEKYFTAEADLAAYSINLYNFTTIGEGNYGVSTFGFDNHTDNQAAWGTSNRWIPGQLKVGYTNPWNFSNIRHCNYFFDKVLPKYEAGQISGNPDNVKHYIGEMYVLRANSYFDKLKSIGDCPIFEIALPDDEAVLIEASKRRPRHKVAHFILDDLTKATELLKDEAPGGKNRISKNVAHLLRARVALFEATWEKYHAGTALVPGGEGWPGKDAEGYDAKTEIDYFFGEAMKSAKIVGDQMVNNLAENTDTPEGMNSSLGSINPYYTMFCDEDMSGYDEVLMWRQFSVSQGVTHNIQKQLEDNGGGTGWTRGLVNSFLMENGLPIYDEGSGYNPEWEKGNVNTTLQNRDSRIRIFTKFDDCVNYYKPDGSAFKYNPYWMVIGSDETGCITGYPIKKGKHYSADMQLIHHYGTSGSLVFRGAEALLIYMEASYEKNHNIDDTASSYWQALRRRAKVDTNFKKTIDHTIMAEEAKGDFGAYSHGQLIDETLYNIRRERRNELIGEAMRWDDLIRWRACDQIKNYQIEGVRFWGSSYETHPEIVDHLKVNVDGIDGNMSSKEISGFYIRPYQKTKLNNLVWDGWNFTEAHYLAPLPQSVFHDTAEGDKTDLSTSPVYQNPGWGRIDGKAPIE